MEHVHLFGREETPFAATYVLLGQAGEGHAVEVHHLIADFLEYTAYDAVLTRVNLETDMTTVGFRELEGIRDDALVVQHHSGANDSLIHFVEFAVERHGVNLLLMEFRVRQLGGEVAVVGQQEHTGGVAVEASHGIDTLRAGVTNDVDNGMTLLRIIRRGDGILGFIEQDIDLALTANGLVVESDIIRRQHLRAEAIHGLAIDGDHTGLDEIIGLTAGTDTCVSQEFIQTHGLCRVLVLLTIYLLFMTGVDTGIAFRLTSKRTLGTLRTGLSVAGEMRTAFSVTGETRATGALCSVAGETRTTYLLCALSVDALSRTTRLTVIVRIVVHTQF